MNAGVSPVGSIEVGADRDASRMSRMKTSVRWNGVFLSGMSPALAGERAKVL